MVLRLVNIENVVPGSILGKSIYTGSGKVLLSAGLSLTSVYISRLSKLEITEIYIDDNISKGIEIVDVVSQFVRLEAKSIVKDIIENQTATRHDISTRLSKVVDNIVEEILANKDTLVSVIDIKTKDNYTFSHCVNVAVLSTVVGVAIGYTIDRLKKLCLGALLHDIGKIVIPTKILNTPEKLTDEEFKEVKRHSEYGYKMVKGNVDYSPITVSIVLMHHEKSDGSGYPLGIKLDKIHECTRIVSVADIYDAMTSDRVYRKKLTPGEAMEYLNGMAYQWFDMPVITAFNRCIAPYPIGTSVRLNTGAAGIVAKINSSIPVRPIVKIIIDSNGNQLQDYYCDLSKELTTSIIEVCTI